MSSLNDTVEGRKGEWMHTSTGKRFFPLDPRPEDICIMDIANGLALDCRYGGQGNVHKFYSVAEHSVLMAEYACERGWARNIVFAVLMHDAAEAYLNDLPRAVKHSIGRAYETLEDQVQEVILQKYNLVSTSLGNNLEIKSLDRQIVPLEKECFMNHPQDWAYDKFQPLEGVALKLWSPPLAKYHFLEMYCRVGHTTGVPIEDTSEVTG